MAIDLASILVAVISLVASLTVAAFAAVINSSKEHRKARQEAKQLMVKYRDPLLLSAEDLQARLWGILEGDVLDYAKKSPVHNDSLFIYTSFVLGQFMTWAHILRREMYLAPLSATDDIKLHSFIEIMNAIAGVMISGRYSSTEDTAFLFLHGHLAALGELMTLSDEGNKHRRLCMGLYEFNKLWKTTSLESEDSVHYWFMPIKIGLETLIERGNKSPESNRLRRLQHLVLDLIALLNPSKQRTRVSGCTAAPNCRCITCARFTGGTSTTERRTLPENITETV